MVDGVDIENVADQKPRYDREEYTALYERDRNLRDSYDHKLEEDEAEALSGEVISLAALPEEVRTERGLQLQNKLKEYTNRILDFKRSNPAATPEQLAQKGYKRDVLRFVLESGAVNTDILKGAIAEMDGQVNEWVYKNACAVIDSYIKTGGEEVFAGTGLPPSERS